MTILCYDSTNPQDIPVNAEMVAGYINGLYAWPASGWARFADKPVWQISVTAQLGVGDAGNVLDIETGDASPNQAGAWALRTIKRGVFPILYCNRANGSQVEAFLTSAGLTTQQCALWIATLDGTTSVTHWNDGTPVKYPCAAVQYLGEPASGGHYDLSLVTDAFGAGGGVVRNMTDSEKLAWVRQAYIGGCGRQPADAELQLWAPQIASDGSNVNAIVANITNSPEAVAWLQHLHATAPPPSTTVPAHKHALTINSETGDVLP